MVLATQVRSCYIVTDNPGRPPLLLQGLQTPGKSLFSIERKYMACTELLALGADRQGFSLLFYGFGSKKSLLESFAETSCQDGGVLAVNGMASGVTIRQILLKISKELRLPVGRAADTSTILKAIQGLPCENPFYILIHNIEGPGMQGTSPAQGILALLPPEERRRTAMCSGLGSVCKLRLLRSMHKYITLRRLAKVLIT